MKQYKDTKKTDSTRKVLSVICILLAGCLWGTMGLWVHRLSDAGLDSLQILAMKNIFSVIWILIYFMIFNRRLLLIRLKDFWCFVGTGILSLVFFGYCYNRTILLASMSVAAILLYTSPIFVTILSRILFREAFTKIKFLALILAFGGCVLVTGLLSGNQSISMLGLMTGLGSGFGYALYSIFSRFALQREYHPFTITFYTFVFSLAVPLIITDWRPIESFVFAGGENLLFCIVYSLITGVLPYMLYTFGLSFVDNGKAAIMATIEPVVATLIGVFILGETMTLSNAAGIALVLSAVVLLNSVGESPA